MFIQQGVHRPFARQVLELAETEALGRAIRDDTEYFVEVDVIVAKAGDVEQRLRFDLRVSCAIRGI